jgi:hypothetical protein
LAQRGKLRVGTAPVAWFVNGSGNGEKCSWGCSGAPICRPKSPARAGHHPGDPLQLNRRFVTRLLRIWGKSHDRFHWGYFFLFRFCGCRAEEGNRALGRSPGQARVHTSEVGVGVGVGRVSATGRGVVRLAASALASLHAARTGMGWLGYTTSAGPCLLNWAVREWEMAVGSSSASGRVSAHSQC